MNAISKSNQTVRPSYYRRELHIRFLLINVRKYKSILEFYVIGRNKQEFRHYFEFKQILICHILCFHSHISKSICTYWNYSSYFLLQSNDILVQCNVLMHVSCKLNFHFVMCSRVTGKTKVHSGLLMMLVLCLWQSFQLILDS